MTPAFTDSFGEDILTEDYSIESAGSKGIMEEVCILALALVLVMLLMFISCVILSKLVNLSGPQLFIVKNGNDTNLTR